MCAHASPLELLSLRIPKRSQAGDWGVFLPGKYQKDCYCQSHWWCYILNGWRTRGSPVGGGCQWGGALWNLQGATEAAEEKEKKNGFTIWIENFKTLTTMMLCPTTKHWAPGKTSSHRFKTIQYRSSNQIHKMLKFMSIRWTLIVLN